MRKNAILLVILIVSLFLFSCDKGNETKEVKKPQPQAKVKIPEAFSMQGTWAANYKSQDFKITLNGDNKGVLSFGEGAAEIRILKWEGEKLSEDRMNLGLYFYSKDKSHFKKGTLRMYNAGNGMKLKMVYTGDNKFSVYNGLYLEESKVAKDDGRMMLTRL